MRLQSIVKEREVIKKLENDRKCILVTVTIKNFFGINIGKTPSSFLLRVQFT